MFRSSLSSTDLKQYSVPSACTAKFLRNRFCRYFTVSLSIRRFWGKGEKWKPNPVGRPDTQATSLYVVILCGNTFTVYVFWIHRHKKRERFFLLLT